MRPSLPVYQGDGSIRLLRFDENNELTKEGNCIVELYDKTTCDGDPMATINYSVKDLGQLYLNGDIRRVQIKR